MEEKDLKRFKKRLKKLEEELKKVITAEENPVGGPDARDEIDRATEMINQELGSRMSMNYHSHLQNVRDALLRVQDGSYGLCGECGRPIPLKRLEALPFTEYCLTCKQEMEQGI